MLFEAAGSGCGEADVDAREVDVMTVVVRAAGLGVETETFRRRDLNFMLFNSRAAFASFWDTFSCDVAGH